MALINRNSIGNIESSLNQKDPELIIDNNDLFTTKFYFNDFYDTRKFNSFIKNCEQTFRKSEQYTTYLYNLKQEKGLHYCAVRGNITDEDASIEFHHYPFTLYDVFYILMTKHIILEEKFTSFSLIREVLELHSKNLIGLVPLSITEHHLVHDGVRVIPLTSVYGNVGEFVNEFSEYMDDEMIEKYNEIIKIK